MIQQESGNLRLLSIAGLHQDRPSTFVLGIDITSQREETINSLDLSEANGKRECRAFQLILDAKVGSVDHKTIDDRDESTRSGAHQGRQAFVVLGVDVCSGCKKTINSVNLSCFRSCHQGRLSQPVSCLCVGPKRQETVHNIDMSFSGGKDERTVLSHALVVVNVGSCPHQTLHNGRVTFCCHKLNESPLVEGKCELGSVVEETVDDLQLSPFASREEWSHSFMHFSSLLFNFCSSGQSLLDLGRCGGREEIRHLEGWFQETMILI